MTKKKILSPLNRYCLSFGLIIIVSGCATSDRSSKVIAIQKSRIQKLEQQLERKNLQIQKLKVGSWIKKPIRPNEDLAFINLHKMIVQKKWIAALKESGRLKSQFPESVKLSSYRYRIFNKMGLKEQAASERDIMKGLISKRRQQGLKK